MPTQPQLYAAPEQLALPLPLADQEQAPPAAPLAVKTLAVTHKRLPREVCDSVGSDFAPPEPLTYIQIALHSLEQDAPLTLNATRQPSAGEWNGWVIWGGTKPPDARFEFKALKVVNVLERYPQLMPYLALATGFSLSLTAQHAEIFLPSATQPASEKKDEVDAAPRLVTYPLKSPMSRATKLFFLGSLLLHIGAIVFIGVADPSATKGSESRAGRASWAGLSVRLNPLAAASSPKDSTSGKPSSNPKTSTVAAPSEAASTPTTTTTAAANAQNTVTPPAEIAPLPAPPPLLTALPTLSTAVAPMQEAPLLIEPIQAISPPSTAVSAMRDQPLITNPIAPIAPPSTAVAQLREAPILTNPIASAPQINTIINQMRDAPVIAAPIATLTTPSTAVALMRDAPILANPIAPVRAPSTAVTAMRDAPILTQPIAPISPPSTRIATLREAPLLSSPIAPIAPPSTVIAAMREAPILAAPIPAVPATIAASTAITPMREAPLITNPIPQITAPKLSQQLAPAPAFAPAPAPAPAAVATNPSTAAPSTAAPATAAATTTTTSTPNTTQTAVTSQTTAPTTTTTQLNNAAAGADPLTNKATTSTPPVTSAAVDSIFGAASGDTKSATADGKNNPALDAEAVRQRIREATRNRETGDFMAATEKRSAFALALAPKVVRKTKEELAIEQAWKPDCRTAYKDSPLGLAAIGPLIWGAVSDNAKCKW